MKRTSGKFFLTALAIGYTVFVLVASLSEPKTIQGLGFNHADKIVHLFIYFVMTVLWLLAVNVTNKKIIFKIAGMLFLFSFLIELAQHFFTKSRSFEVLDLLANFFGIVIGYYFMRSLINISGSLKSF